MKLKKLLLASKVDEAVSGTGGNGGVLEGLLVDTVVGGTWLHRGMITYIKSHFEISSSSTRACKTRSMWQITKAILIDML